MVPREQQRDEIASDYYLGGMVVERSGKLHPALYYKGLARCVPAARCRDLRPRRRSRGSHAQAAGWRVETERGARHGRRCRHRHQRLHRRLTPALRRRVVPIASHIIATEELPARPCPLADPKRPHPFRHPARLVLLPDVARRPAHDLWRPRAVSRKSGRRSARRSCYRYMTARFPQLHGVKVTHAWTGNTAFTLDALPHMGQLEGLHFCLGCNGSGIAMMTYLGWQTARKIARVANYACSFDTPIFPGIALYSGDPWFLPALGGWYRLRDRRRPASRLTGMRYAAVGFTL